MKTILFIIFLLSGIRSQAQEITINVPVPCILLMSDTTTTSTGAFKTTTALLKRKGYIVYSLSKDSLNTNVTYKYLDGNKNPIDLKKYVIWLSREKSQ